jgi:hypothetical protein
MAYQNPLKGTFYDVDLEGGRAYNGANKVVDFGFNCDFRVTFGFYT